MATLNIDYNALAAALMQQPGFRGATLGGVASDGGTVSDTPGVRDLLSGGVVELGEGVETGRAAVGSAEPIASASGPGSTSSWADEVAESDTSSVSVSGVVSVGPEVRSAVKFGGFADVVGGDVGEPVVGAGFFSTIVRRSEATRFRLEIEALCEVKLPRRARLDLAVCTYTAAVMPAAIKEGKARLNALAALGDAALAVHVVARSFFRGSTAEQIQNERGRLTTDKYFISLMMQRGWHKFVTYPSGLDPASVKSTATAFEAIVGVLTVWLDVSAVDRFVRATIV